jgi:hypothetical protein
MKLIFLDIDCHMPDAVEKLTFFKTELAVDL